MALTNAQKQARWRERRRAELQALREQLAALNAEPDLDPSGLDTRSIEVNNIMLWPGMPLPEAERLQELEQAIRTGQRFTIVVAECEGGNGYTLVSGAGILVAACKAQLDSIHAIVLPYGSLVDVLSRRINELVAELQRLQPNELIQAHERIAAPMAGNEWPKMAEPTKSRNHPRHEDRVLTPSPYERVLRGELVEMQLRSRSFFIPRDMMDTAYRIKEQLELRALKEADAFEALQRIAVAGQA